jgi:hypothetical protein
MQRPSLAALSRAAALLDLAGDGNLDLVDFGSRGFFARTEAGWDRFPFPSLPNIDWQDPNLRFADLTSDGHADILVPRIRSRDESYAEEGSAQRPRPPAIR